MITRKVVADKIMAYLHHEIALAELVAWAEDGMMDAELDDADTKLLAKVLGTVGVADVKGFELGWQEYEALLLQLGYSLHSELVAA